MVTGIAHVGCIVNNRDQTMDFMSNVIGISKNKRHHVDYEANSKIMGIPNSDLNIGFAKQEDSDIIFEMIEYISPLHPKITNSVKTIGSSILAFEVPDVGQILANLGAYPADIVVQPEYIQEGPFTGRKHSILHYDNLLFFELIETPHLHSSRLCKISYLVRDINEHEVFFKKYFNITKRMDYTTKLLGMEFVMASFQHRNSQFYIELATTQKETETVDIYTGLRGLAHVCYHIDDLDTMYRTMSEQGIWFTTEPATLEHGLNKGASATYIKAPDNLPIELYQGRLLRMDN